MRAVILAAGLGSRLGSTPKPLLELYTGTTILGHTIKQFEGLGLAVAIVVGNKAESIMEAFSDRATFIYNPLYATTATLYSLKVAADLLLDESLLVCFADQVTERDSIQSLLDIPDTVLVTPLAGDYHVAYTLHLERDEIIDVLRLPAQEPSTGFGFGGFAHLSRATLDKLNDLSPKTLTTQDLPILFMGCRAIKCWCDNINTSADLERVRRRYK